MISNTYLFSSENGYNQAKDAVYASFPVLYYKTRWMGYTTGGQFRVELPLGLKAEEEKQLTSLMQNCGGQNMGETSVDATKSATRRSTYVFDSEVDYNRAKDDIYYWNSQIYNDSDKVYFYGHWGDQYRIDLMNGLTPIEAETVASKLREHHGQFVVNP